MMKKSQKLVKIRNELTTMLEQIDVLRLSLITKKAIVQDKIDAIPDGILQLTYEN
jgi:hypothetical protein